MVQVSGYGSFEVDLEFDDFWANLDSKQQEYHAREILEAWPELVSFERWNITEYLEDPAKRLEVIVALRKLGYTVESA